MTIDQQIADTEHVLRILQVTKEKYFPPKANAKMRAHIKQARKNIVTNVCVELIEAQGVLVTVKSE